MWIKCIYNNNIYLDGRLVNFLLSIYVFTLGSRQDLQVSSTAPARTRRKSFLSSIRRKIILPGSSHAYRMSTKNIGELIILIRMLILWNSEMKKTMLKSLFTRSICQDATIHIDTNDEMRIKNILTWHIVNILMLV